MLNRDVDYEEEGEERDANSTNDDEKISYPWTSYHTFTMICLRICGDLLFVLPMIFDEELRVGSLASLQTFSYVNICRFIGTFLSIFWSPFNMKWFSDNSQNITVVYAGFGGLFAVSFGLCFFLNTPPYIIALQSVIYLLYGVSYSIYNSGTLATAMQHSRPEAQGTLLSLLSMSWSLSSGLYVVCAYLIKRHPSLPFITFGALLMAFAGLIHATYNFPVQATPNVHNLYQHLNLRQVINVIKDDFYCIVFAISFFVGVASGANLTVLGSPFLHDLYGLDVTLVGWALMVIFVGELSSNLYMVACIEKQGFFATAALGMVLKITAAVCLLAISLFRDATFGSNLVVALCTLFVVFFAWELVFVSLLAAVNHAVDIKEQNVNHENSARSHKRLVFMIQFVAISAAKPIGVWFASEVWRHNSGLFDVGLFYLANTLVASVLYCVYYLKVMKHNARVTALDTDSERSPLI